MNKVTGLEVQQTRFDFKFIWQPGKVSIKIWFNN